MRSRTLHNALIVTGAQKQTLCLSGLGPLIWTYTNRYTNMIIAKKGWWWNLFEYLKHMQMMHKTFRKNFTSCFVSHGDKYTPKTTLSVKVITGLRSWLPRSNFVEATFSQMHLVTFWLKSTLDQRCVLGRCAFSCFIFLVFKISRRNLIIGSTCGSTDRHHSTRK